MKYLFLIISCIFIFPLNILKAQSISSLHTGKIVELECVETSSGSFVSASMERIVFSANNRKERVLIHRSTNRGATWTLIDSIEGPKDIVDPVLAKDDAGNIYLTVMQLQNGAPLKVDLDLYKSIDDGLSWSFVSSPNLDTGIADYPQMVAQGNGYLYLVYSRFTIKPGSPTSSEIVFKKSLDGGISWSAEKNWAIDSQNVVGPDITFLDNNLLGVSYGSTEEAKIYRVESQDLGTTWSLPSMLLNTHATDNFNITKPISQGSMVNYSALVSHQPHQTASPINYHYSQDAGNTWHTQVVDSGAYAQAFIDDFNNIHLIYNKKEGADFIIYHSVSKDSGKTFNRPISLYTAPFQGDEKGEYQSVILGNDQKVYVTFCDWSDASKAKMLVYSLSTIINIKEPVKQEAYIYPNPTHGKLYVNTQPYGNVKAIALCDAYGRLLQTYTVNSNVWIHELDISHLPRAGYLLKIETHNQVFIHRLVKE